MRKVAGTGLEHQGGVEIASAVEHRALIVGEHGRIVSSAPSSSRLHA